MNEFIAQYAEIFNSSSTTQLVGFGIFFLVFYFLPTLLAACFNRSQLTKIAVLNIPAGFSMLVWGGLLVWACTGKMGEHLTRKLRRGAAMQE
ncbi:superinfection immunity protein [Simiduia aestuariiviva]|uniref:ABC-type antimicrobial peptide transport system permease subunit n=1 Tax=Simiduia aestuariiviva TaxID=1510459 RepID=A0A839US78_9GAMM|nr:superinfection immunity protein [Simiduia aestuariiviva]MBB3169330.1 ABC-type antimicrobial peptide transport system permease subunit [Simiduia aestuariiviva]